ncbi:MAG: hypothetical protein R3F37_11230 [Candidatus Competibacteraceae bacterium]
MVALPKPAGQQGQWYFQRYAEQLPNPGEIVFFDQVGTTERSSSRSWNFAQDQYNTFMQQVPEFEHMLYEDNLELVKFWFSISKTVQAERFDSRRDDPLKQWKISPVDERAQQRWELYTKYKEDVPATTPRTVRGSLCRRTTKESPARKHAIRAIHPYPTKGKTTRGHRWHPT